MHAKTHPSDLLDNLLVERTNSSCPIGCLVRASMCSCDPLHKIDHSCAHRFAFDPLKGTTESGSIARRQESSHVRPRIMLLAVLARGAVEEVNYWNFQRC